MRPTLESVVTTTALLTNATAVGTGLVISGPPKQKTFQAELNGDSATGATVVIEGSNTGFRYVTLGTITLDATTRSAGFYHEAPWGYVRASLTAIAGTGASVTAVMGT